MWSFNRSFFANYYYDYSTNKDKQNVLYNEDLEVLFHKVVVTKTLYLVISNLRLGLHRSQAFLEVEMFVTLGLLDFSGMDKQLLL